MLNAKKNVVGVIILNWNGYFDTVKCIESVLKNDYQYFKVIVVDNGSKNNEPAKLKKKFGSRIIVLESKNNLGYCGGNNLGAQYCKKLKYDYFIILNNDTIVEPKLISILIKAMNKDDKIATLNPIVYQYYKKGLIENSGQKFSLWHGEITPYDFGKKQLSHHPNADILCGTCFIFRTKVLNIIKYLFDENFYCYYEDPDLSIRLKKAGYKIGVCYDTFIFHKGSASSDKISGFAEFYAIRNRFFVVRKNASFMQKSVFLFIMVLFYFPFRIIRITIFKKRGNFGYFLKGYKTGLKIFFGFPAEKYQ